MKKKILVTGGLGYIGAHTAVELIEANYEVVIVDDLSNTNEKVLEGIKAITGVLPQFYNNNLCDATFVKQLFKEHTFQGIIHFAAFKAVGESVEQPLAYYENNTVGLLELLKNYKVGSFVFSSSCTVYGDADVVPITEDTPMKPASSPYAHTKQIGEQVLQSTSQVNSNLNSIILRYFNPIGAHKTALIGELPNGVPQNLVPFITQTAIGKREQLKVFGNDYDTIDGTCIRDYIHVVDLAKAHVKALEFSFNEDRASSHQVFNIGTGTGSSVLQVIQAFEKATGEKLNYAFAPRRAGDVTQYCANTDKANQVLGWKAIYSLEEAMLSAWEWEKYIYHR